MNYCEFIPPAPLSGLVKCIWVLESEEVHPEPVKEKILPDGCAELIFHYGDHFRQFTTAAAEIQPRSFVFGQIRQFIEIGPTGKTGIIAVRFFPNGLGAFMGMPVFELSNRAIGIADVFGANGIELEERIMLARGTQERIHILCEFLIRCLKRKNKPDHLGHVVNYIVQNKGRIDIESLSSQFNISPRQLERKFMTSVGMSPKALSKIIRFQNTFRLLQEGRINSLTALAYEGGYYDQAHFIRDFREFSGINPRDYFSLENTFSGYFVSGS